MVITTAQYKGERVVVVNLEADKRELQGGGSIVYSSIVYNKALRPVLAKELTKIKLYEDK